MTADLERFDPIEQRGRIAQEHLHRYALCREHVAGRRVLDLACGTGYGTALLAAAGAIATGVDIDAKAISKARKRHGGSDISFAIADCFDLPFAAGSFDVVVANEMIEHLDDHDALLVEIKRVLVDGGLLLVSTPNKPVYNRFKTPNPFHVSEMDTAEFQQLLRRHFANVRLTATRMAVLSVGYPLDAGEASGNLGAARIYRSSVAANGQPSVSVGELALADPEYLLAACSDGAIEAMPAESSLLAAADDDLWAEQQGILAWASQLHDEDERLRADLAEARRQLDIEQAAAQAATATSDRLAERLGELRTMTSLTGEALARERQSLAHERETLAREQAAVQRDMAEQRALVARLLGQIGGTAVADDQPGVIAALFSLNETMVGERYRREQAERDVAESRAAADAQARLAADRLEQLTRAQGAIAEHEAALAAQHHQLLAVQHRLAETEAAVAERSAAATAYARDAEQRAAELAEARVMHAAAAEQDRERLAALASELAATTADRDASRAAAAANADAAAACAEQLAGAQAAAAEAADASKRRLESLDEQLAGVEAALALERANHRSSADTAERQAGQLAELTAQLAEARARLTAPAPAVVDSAVADNAVVDNIAIARARTRAGFDRLHTQIATQLAEAPQRIAGRIGPPPAPRRKGWTRRLRGSPPFSTLLFDRSWLEAQRPGAGRLSLARYLADPALHGVDPHPLFDASGYLRRHADVAASGLAPLAHYVLHGWREGRDPHPMFRNDWYLAQNPDVAADGAINPLDHYLLHGWREGRWPNPAFDPRAYLDRYPDVAAAGLEPLTHFVAHGRFEGREPQFRGWNPDWAGLVAGDGAGLLDHLLGAPAPPALPDAEPRATPATAWPPQPLQDFWPPQAMRDLILDGHGEAWLGRYWYLMSVMATYADRQAEFSTSDDCRQLVDHLRARAAARALPAGTTPDASIIVPVYNNVLDTLLCLASVLELDDADSFEIIVADDGSTDATAQLVTSIGGIVRYIRQPRNLGFLGNCNAAALQAEGRHIALLNNDTLVFPGWLTGLLAPFYQFDNIGLVGSKLINWDGTLQEAGGIFWRDGSAWNFGRNQHPRAPEFSYLKDVDYCSGASIAIPTAVWRSQGGFDPAYTPAYCEDSDLAFRLRAAGYRTLYSPASEVVHHEGRSHGRDLATGIKAYQVANQQRLFERWQPVLESEHYPNAQNMLRARDRSFNKPHVLVIDHYVPQWDRDAGSRTIFEFIKVLLDDGCSVTLWPDNLWYDPDYTPRLQALGVEVIYGPSYQGRFDGFMADRAGLYDAVLLSRPHVAASYIDTIRARSGARIVYYGHDVHFRRMMAQRTLEGRVAEDADVAAMKAQELSVCNRSDVILYPSADEIAFMARLVDPGVRALAVPAYRFPAEALAAAEAAAPQRAPMQGDLRLLFVGGFGHPPNVDAIVWFCNEIMPVLIARGHGVALKIVGSKPPAAVLALRQPAVEVLGFVSDAELHALYRSSDIVIAPLRYGAGVKGKVVEAMAMGVPVVTTDVGAQGLEAATDSLFIADTAAAFAGAIEQARQHDQARARVLAGLAFIRDQYSTGAMQRVLATALTG